MSEIRINLHQELGELKNQLEQSRTSFKKLVETSMEAVMLVDEQGTILLANAPAESLFSVSSAQLLGTPFGFPLILGETAEASIVLPNQEKRLVELRTVEVMWDQKTAFLTSFRDISEQRATLEKLRSTLNQAKQAQARLEYESLHDSLTRLPNRAMFFEQVAMCLNRAKRKSHYRFAVLYLDLDRFKNVNDSLGHSAGDQLLQEIGRRLRACVRPGDTVARLGGDEFCLLLDDIKGVGDAVRVARRVLSRLGQAFDFEGREFFIAASIGIALKSDGQGKAEDVVSHATQALVLAKKQGKGKFEIFNQEAYQEALDFLSLETEIRRGLDRGEFRLYFQPIVNLEKGRLAGFEALVRWQHPQKGLLPPASFLPVAKESGLIVDLDRWSMGEACRQANRWPVHNGHGPITVSVNLTTAHFSNPNFPQELAEVIRQEGTNSERLRLEITEDALSGDKEAITRTLQALKDMDIVLYVDDFGTGYSSLSRLLQFPVDYLKIDRSFITGLDKSENSRSIVRAIVLLADNLGMRSVAEGVEHKDQVEALMALPCAEAQGYYFSPPVDAERTLAMAKSPLLPLV